MEGHDNSTRPWIRAKVRGVTLDKLFTKVNLFWAESEHRKTFFMYYAAEDIIIIFNISRVITLFC